MVRRLWWGIWVVAVFVLVACGGSDPSYVIPPPPDGVGSTLQDGSVAQPDSGSGADGSTGDDDDGGATVTSFRVNITVSGLAGGQIVVRQTGTNHGNPTNTTGTISANGTASPFLAQVDTGTSYSVLIDQNPVFVAGSAAAQTCGVTSGGTGTVGTSAPSITIVCGTNTGSLGGSVVGLNAGNKVGLSLTYTGADGKTTTAATSTGAGAFAFSGAKLASNTPYSVSINQQPANQTCRLVGGSGIATGADASPITVNCSANRYSLGGTITGLAFAACTPPVVDDGGNLATDPLLPHCGVRLRVVTTGVAGESSIQYFDANGAFAFTRLLSAGDKYTVSIDGNPLRNALQPGSRQQTCTITNAAGQIGNADVTGAAGPQISCTNVSYAISASITGNEAGSNLQVQLQAGIGTLQSATLNQGETKLTFTGPIDSGTSYSISAGSPQLTCTVLGGAGVVGNNAPDPATITCTPATYNVSTSVSLLAVGTSVSVSFTCTNAAGCPAVQTVKVGPNGLANGAAPLKFPQPIPNGATYTLAIAVPPGNADGQKLPQTCTVYNPTGTMPAKDLASAEVAKYTYPVQQIAPGPFVRCSEGASCNAIKTLDPALQNGIYALAGNVPFRAYCDYTTDALPGTSYSSTAVGAPSGAGTNLHLVTEATLCPAGWEIVVPRTHAHLDALFTGATALGLASPWPGGAVPIFRATANGNGDYTKCAMNSSEDPLKACGTGSTRITDWTPTSGTRWFLYAISSTEPDGNYTANAFLNYTDTHDLNGITIDDANATPTTGGSYMCAPANDKNAL
jgi:hypothetical protein